MTAKHVFAWICIILLCRTDMAIAQWSSIGGPCGETITAFWSSDETLLAGANLSIYRSSDGGENWTWSSAGLSEIQPLSLGSHGPYVFVGRAGDGIYRSDNNGLSWTQSTKGLPLGLYVYAFASLGGSFFAGTNAGVYVSTDNGDSWASSSTGLGNGSMLTLAASGHRLLAGGTDGLFVSSDGGSHWIAVQGGLPKTEIHSLVVRGSDAFAGTLSEGVFMSSDSCQTWVSRSQNLPASSSVEALAISGSRLLAGTVGHGIHWSEDSGVSWVKADSQIGAMAVNTLFAVGTSVFAGTLGNGPFATSDGGATWVAKNSGLGRHQVISLLETAGGKLLAGTQNGSGVYVFPGSNGTDWSPSNKGLPLNAGVSSFCRVSSYIFASVYLLGAGGGVYRSSDEGETWIPVNSHLTRATDMIEYGGRLYVGDVVNGVYFSANNGSTWQEQNNGLLYRNSCSFAAADVGLFLGMPGAGVYCLKMLILPWQGAGAGLPASGVYCIGATAGVLTAGVVPVGISRSTDNGVSWKAVTSGVGQVRRFAVSGTSIFAAASEFGIWRSPNQGMTWLPVGVGLTEGAYIYTLEVGRSSLFVGTLEHGIWMRPLSELTAVRVPPELQLDDYSLEQNFPNPFNPKTVIVYRVPMRCDVRIGIYDVLGREIAVLVEDIVDQGKHEIAWDASTFASGLYICRMTAGGSTLSRKMLVVR